MTVYILGIVVALFVLILWYWHRRQLIQNEKTLLIYNRLVQTLIEDLLADRISYDTYRTAVNIMRNVYNEQLVGWNKKRLTLPPMRLAAARTEKRARQSQKREQ